MRTLKWFENRIGKIIYREKTSCNCDTCKSVSENGLIVWDKHHAEYLHMVSCDLGIKYRDNL